MLEGHECLGLCCVKAKCKLGLAPGTSHVHSARIPRRRGLVKSKGSDQDRLDETCFNSNK